MDVDFPILLGAELFRPDPSYIAKFVFQPNVVHDFGTSPATAVQLDRYGFFGDGDASYTEAARVRQSNQTIGTVGSRGLAKEKLTVTLQNFTGPSAGSSDPTQPGNLKIPTHDIIRAMRFLYDLNNPAMFHQSIGSLTLIQDWRKWQDRVYINQALRAGVGVMASRTSGGYYNPLGIPDNGTYAVGPQQLKFYQDVDKIVSDMRGRNVPPFQSNLGPVYHALTSPNAIKDLRRDPDFREVARYPGMIPIQMLKPGMMPMSAPMVPNSMNPMNLNMTPGGGMGIPNWGNNPNMLIQQGGFYGQSGFMYGEMMPAGFVFEGVRFFDTSNMPTADVVLTYTAADSAYPGTATGSATRVADLMIFAGQQCIGEGVYGEGPAIAVNENTDYGRQLQVIWTQDSGYEVLNMGFFTIARTYSN